MTLVRDCEKSLTSCYRGYALCSGVGDLPKIKITYCITKTFFWTFSQAIPQESDDKDIDLDGEIDDPNFQDPVHNLQYSSDSDECEMDIDHDTIS
ncbi:hypothetical protein TNCT_446331 [Trichonephila clavata]|uniref:Uncharacterized protein n=1 Tax=Trichonephila clavata TaxID=2740835 RepID=A0A8X6IEG9_TRICU|nr:hypothetical protein TNCT_446331 [Trichonephila clavata]